MSELPKSSNFFSSLYTRLTREQVVELYRLQGWRTRKCGWQEYEIYNDFAELVIEAESPILMHGLVADVLVNAEAIFAPLDGIVGYSAESYDDEERLLKKWFRGAA